MRFVQKVSGLTTVHEVDKAYGVLTLTVFNIVPFRSYTLRPTFSELLFRGVSNSVFVEFRLMSSVASNRCPFRTFLSLGNRKKSHGARSGEYGGCCNWAVPCLAKNCCTRCEVCAGALSWCRIQSPSRHFFRSFSANWFTQTSQDLHVEFLVNCLPVGSVLVVYNTLRIKKNASNMTFCFASHLVPHLWSRRRGTLPLWRLQFCLRVVPVDPGLVTCHNVLKKIHVLACTLKQITGDCMTLLALVIC